MPGNPLREGFREVLRDPALILIEIGWRWAFGILAAFVCITLALVATTGTRVDPHFFEAISSLSSWESAQNVASILATLLGIVLRFAIAGILFLSVCWVILGALGRRATLLRPALAHGADLRVCFAISALRVAAALAALLIWIVTGLVLGTIVAVNSSTVAASAWLIATVLIPVFLLLAFFWSAANWYLSFAPLFPGNRWIQSIKEARSFVQRRRDEILEISIAVGAMRLVLFIAALALSFLVSAVITNARIVVADLTAVALLYFLVADFLGLARLSAFARLRDSALTLKKEEALQSEQPGSAVVFLRADEKG